MEENLNSKFDCFKQLFIDTDSPNSAGRPKSQSQLFYEDFYEDFLKLKNSRDSIVSIKRNLTKEEWINILVQFSLKATKLKGSELAKKKSIEEDLKFLKANLDDIPESEFGELYKHIVERWTGETYESALGNFTIDFVEGHRPPCSL
jgi:hypothetical protein